MGWRIGMPANEPERMNDLQQGSNTADVRLSLEVDPALAPILIQEATLNKALIERLAHDLADLMETLGIPGAAAIEMTVLQHDALRTGRLLRISVNGRPLGYSDD